MKLALIFFIGFVLDYLFGDPKVHPVRWIGHFIYSLERALYNPTIASGALVSAITIFAVGAMVYAINAISIKAGVWVHIAVGGGLLWLVIAARSLKAESMRVYDSLVAGDLGQARKDLSWIVGRDTEQLNEEAIIKAAVETVAENTSDGVIAPIFYFALGGAPLAYVYKAINTLDSMIGYKNERYINFGKFAARLDDVANFIPAIFTAYMMIAAAFLLRLDCNGAYKIYKRDKNNHSSPNSGKPEAACAGALGLRLGGASRYKGVLVEKPHIGDGVGASPEDIKKANRLMYLSSILAAMVLSIIYFLVLQVCYE